MSQIVSKVYNTTCIGYLLEVINNDPIIVPVCEQILTDGTSNMYFYFVSALSPTEDAQLDNILVTLVCPIYHNPIDGQYIDNNNIGSNILWTSDKINSELTTNVDHNNLLNKGTNTHVQIDSHLVNTNNPHNVSDTQLVLRALGGNRTLSDLVDDTCSVGWIEGGTITDAGGGNINIDAGEGLIRPTNSNTDQITYISWVALNGVSIPSGASRYVYVYYNSGNPVLQVLTTEAPNNQQYIYIGEVHNVSTPPLIHNDHRPINDFPNRLMEWVEYVFGTVVTSGEQAYDPSSPSRYVGVTMGKFFDRHFIEYNSPAINTSISDTFIEFYRNGTGDWVRTAGKTQIDNSNYDNGSGTLQSMTTLFYSCRYIIRSFLGHIAVLIGQNQYAASIDAENESLPTRPEEYDEHGFYVAKIIIQNGATSPTKIVSIKPTLVNSISSSGTAVHNELGGLQGGTASQYYHLTSLQYSQLHINTNDPTASEKSALVGTYGSPSNVNKFVTDTDPRLSTVDSLVKNSSNDTTSGYLSSKILAGTNISFVTNNPGANESLTINAVITGALNDPGTNGIVVRTANTITTSRTLVQPSSGLTITNPDGVSGNPIIALANDLAALEGLSGTGFAVRSAADTWVQRNLVAPAFGITISNTSGVSGNPTFALANDLSALEGLPGTGFAVRSAPDTWVQRTLVQPSAGLIISNTDGVSGNPTFALANDLSALEGLTSTGYAKRTATDTWTTGLVDINTETTSTLSIAKGGTGQTTQTAAFNALSPLTNKGDLISRDSTNNVRVPVGANNQIIVADSTQSTGIKWGTIPFQNLSNVNPAISPSAGHVVYWDTVNSRWDSIQLFVPNQSRILLTKFAPIGILSGTAIIDYTTTPDVTAGVQLWSLSVTPQSTNSKFRITTSIMFSITNAASAIVLTLFRNNTLVGSMVDFAANSNGGQTVTFLSYDSPATASPITYSVRVGKSSGNATWYINRFANSAYLGGSLSNNSYSVEEIV